MSDTSAGRPNPPRYEIRIKGHLAARWAAWFDGMTLTTHGDGTTVLEGLVTDQAALHGLLHKVRRPRPTADLGNAHRHRPALRRLT